MSMKLDQDQVDEICRLREERGWSYRRIAKRLGVSPSAVSGRCLQQGAEHPTKVQLGSNIRPGSVHQRGDHEVRRFTLGEDMAMVALAEQGMGASAIGRAFDPPRRPNCIAARLATLARREARAERLQVAA